MAHLLYPKESYVIQGGAFEIYKKFRNRHKEQVYLRSLIEYIKSKGMEADKEAQIPVYFQEKKVGAYVPDIVVNKVVFVELKCKPAISKDDVTQFWHYLTSSDYTVGYLINFGHPRGLQIIRKVYDTARRK